MITTTHLELHEAIKFEEFLINEIGTDFEKDVSDLGYISFTIFEIETQEEIDLITQKLKELTK